MRALGEIINDRNIKQGKLASYPDTKLRRLLSTHCYSTLHHTVAGRGDKTHPQTGQAG